MRHRVMNVTRAEFNDIWHACHDLHGEPLVRFMELHYGCERYTNYAVVVHRRAPAIPMMSWKLPRFDVGRASCTVEDCHDDAHTQWRPGSHFEDPAPPAAPR